MFGRRSDAERVDGHDEDLAEDAGGRASSRADAGTEDAPSPATAGDAAGNPPEDGTSAEQGGDGRDESEAKASEADEAKGSFFSEGAGAMREMSAAKRAHASAKDELGKLDERIKKERDELDYRRGIAGRYDEIVDQETQRKSSALKQAEDAEAEAGRIDAEVAGLKDDFKAMRDADAATEKRLKRAYDAAAAKEASERETGARLQRRLDDAKRNLENARTEKDAGIKAAQNNIDVISERLQGLHDEYAELQRDPSANTANYSVRTAELETQMSDVSEELRQARDELTRVTSELDRAIDDAQRAVKEAEKPIEAAKESFEQVTKTVDDARDALDDAKKDATARQKELRTKISDREKAAQERRDHAEAMREDAGNAERAIAEATDIRDHPEVADELERSLAADETQRETLAGSVEQLAATEKDVRRRTRRTRYAFIALIAALVVIIVAAVILVVVVSQQVM